jgi:hypothetical protein
MGLVGASHDVEPAGMKVLGKMHYLIENEAMRWRTNIPNYPEVRYANVYPGIDLVFYGNGQQVEYDFHVRPGTGTNPGASLLPLRVWTPYESTRPA